MIEKIVLFGLGITVVLAVGHAFTGALDKEIR